MKQKQIRNQTGLTHIRSLLQQLIPEEFDLEHPTSPEEDSYLPPPDIPTDDKETAAAKFTQWADKQQGTILLFTDGSKQQDGTGGSVWHCINGGSAGSLRFRGRCNIGKHCESEDAEIHAIREGLRVRPILR